MVVTIDDRIRKRVPSRPIVLSDAVPKPHGMTTKKKTSFGSVRASTHARFCSSQARMVHKLKGLPPCRSARLLAEARPSINLLPLTDNETISAILPLPDDEADLGPIPSDVRKHRAARCRRQFAVPTLRIFGQRPYRNEAGRRRTSDYSPYLQR